MSNNRNLQDHYFKEAKRNGYRSRAAYKLIEIDEKKTIFKKGYFVLDLGSAPGSWLQVASERVGSKGKVCGVDLKAIEGPLPTNVVTLQNDVNKITTEYIEEILAIEEPSLFDVILSDMAPNTTGNKTIDHHGSMHLCNTVLDLVVLALKPHGDVVMKVFEGEAYPDLMNRAKKYFKLVKGFKPKASRAISTELFLICKDRIENISSPMKHKSSLPKTGWN